MVGFCEDLDVLIEHIPVLKIPTDIKVHVVGIVIEPEVCLEANS